MSTLGAIFFAIGTILMIISAIGFFTSDKRDPAIMRYYPEYYQDSIKNRNRMILRSYRLIWYGIIGFILFFLGLLIG